MNDGRLRVLVLSTFDGTNANVIRDFLFSFKTHSKHEYYYIFDCRIVDEDTDFSSFDVILIFWSVDLLGGDLWQPRIRERIRKASALKVLFRQDEYRDVRRMSLAMSDLGIQVMFTCVAERDHDIFYPKSLIPTLEATYTVLPGYVPGYLERPRVNPKKSLRSLDIGYRSRELPYWLGDLAREKRTIGDRFEGLAREHGLRSDISVRERDRLYGQRWLNFLVSSRCVLGSASGASVVDFTGEIRGQCAWYLSLHPEATYDEVKREFFADVDWKVVIDTVSPRVFEATALGCALVQLEGGYAGILQGEEHYICVKRDYSNASEVIDRVKDVAFCREVAERTHAELIASGQYTYRAFALRFDGLLARHLPNRRASASLSALGFYGRNYLQRRQAIVPFKDRLLFLPSGKTFRELTLSVLMKLTRGGAGPGSALLVDRPAEVVTKASLGVRAMLRIAPVRAVLRYCCDGERRMALRLYALMNDSVKIDIVRQARSGRLKSSTRFRIAVRYDRSTGVVALESLDCDAADRTRARDSGTGAEGDVLPADLSSALVDGEVRMIIWNHSALSEIVIYCPEPLRDRNRWMIVGLGEGGVYRFEALMRVYRQAPRVVGAAILAMLRGEREF